MIKIVALLRKLQKVRRDLRNQLYSPVRLYKKRYTVSIQVFNLWERVQTVTRRINGESCRLDGFNDRLYPSSHANCYCVTGQKRLFACMKLKH